MSKRNTHIFILRWNPNESSFRSSDYELFFQMATRGGIIEEFSWEVSDWRKVEKDDVFFFVRIGTDDDGIIMHGRFAGNCRLDKINPDGSSKENGRKSKTHSAPLIIQGMFRGNEQLSSAVLEKRFPEIDWHGGTSGEALPMELGYALVSYVNSVINAEISSANGGSSDSESE